LSAEAEREGGLNFTGVEMPTGKYILKVETMNKYIKFKVNKL